MSKYINTEPMICDDCFHNTVCRLNGNEMLEWCSTRVPSADVVEVVRCKDCIHYDMKEEICRYPVYAMCREKDDFCSRGEREEKE